MHVLLKCLFDFTEKGYKIKNCGSRVSVFRIWDDAGDGADFTGLARWMLGLDSGLTSSGSKSSSRSARGSSGSAAWITFFIYCFWTTDCRAVNDKETFYMERYSSQKLYTQTLNFHYNGTSLLQMCTFVWYFCVYSRTPTETTNWYNSTQVKGQTHIFTNVPLMWDVWTRTLSSSPLSTLMQQFQKNKTKL